MAQERDLIFKVKGKAPRKTQAVALITTGISQISASIYQRWSPASGFRHTLVNCDQSLNWSVQAKYPWASEPGGRMNLAEKNKLSKTAWAFTPETDSLITPFLHPWRLLLEGDTYGAAKILPQGLNAAARPYLTAALLIWCCMSNITDAPKSMF